MPLPSVDLSKVSFVTTAKLSKKKASVEVGFLDLASAQQFHQLIAERSTLDARTPRLEKAAKEAAEFITSLSRELAVSFPADVRAAIEAKLVHLTSEKYEQGRNAVILFDECRRLREQLAKLEPE